MYLCVHAPTNNSAPLVPQPGNRGLNPGRPLVVIAGAVVLGAAVSPQTRLAVLAPAVVSGFACVFD